MLDSFAFHRRDAIPDLERSFVRMLFSGASMERYEECQRRVREVLKLAKAAQSAAARQCWLEIADEWASLAAEWLQMQARFAARGANPRAYEAE